MKATFLIQLVLIALAYTLLTSNTVQPQSPQNSNSGAQAELRQILLTVLDRDSQPIDTLQMEDLRLFEDDQLQEIAALQRLNSRPLSLAILIDTSVSQERTLPKQKLAADSFIQRIMRLENDQAAVVTFTGKATVEQGFTRDVSLLRQAIARVKIVRGYRGGGFVVPGKGGSSSSRDAELLVGTTALWDAIANVCDDLLSPSVIETRKAIILFSNGYDTTSKLVLAGAIERAVKSNIAVYSIGMGNEGNFGLNKGELQKLSEQTGGHAFFPKNEENLRAAFADVEQELHSQFRIAYRSTQSRFFRKIKIELVSPALRAKDWHLSYQRIVLPSKQ